MFLDSWGGGCRLINIVGASKALELFTSAKRVTAKEALDMGLANHVLEADGSPDEVLSKAKQWLRQYTWGDSEPIQACKRIVTAARFQSTLGGALALEASSFSSVWGKPSHLKAMSSNVKHK